MLALPIVANGADLSFTPSGGGTFIYCNNQESVERSMLSDKSNPKPEYLMNNENLGEGKYSLYVSLLNHTELRNKEGKITETGFDIETDVYIKANADTQLEITAIGYEVPALIETYANGALSRNEGDWSCIQAIADYTGREIRNVRGESSYIPRPFEKVTVTLKKNEVMWLSKYIDNYSAVNWLKPVHILADLQILSGNIDLNIAALKSDGKIGDRSHHCDDAAFGKYYRDRQYKGIADSLPYMYSDTMEYVITDETRDGTELPVTVYNHYSPNGQTVTKWFTHLNPLEDIWSRAICAQSDMLPLYYKDKTKKSYYGVLVPSSKKSDTWYFDVNHSDLAAYEGTSKKEQANHSPNALLTTKIENSGTACNLGNYGVFVNYQLAVTNEGTTTRYFNYNLKTTANNVVSLKDKDGNYLLPYSYSKGQTDAKRDDIMAYVELPAGKTTEFIIEILLPMNNPGGMENSFIITDNPPVVIESEVNKSTTLKQDNFTGKEYYKWGADCLYVSTDGESWKTKFLTEKTKKAFDGRWNSYKITSAGDGYIARYAPFQTDPSYYHDMLKYYKNLYILDNTFNVTNVHAFESFVADATYANGTYYVKADKIYYSIDGRNWAEAKTLKTLPVSSNNGYSFAVNDGKYYISEAADSFIPVDYGNDKPEYLEVFGDFYCYAKDDTLYVSKDGMYFDTAKYPEEIKNAAFVNGELLINDGAYGFNTTNLNKNRITIINNKAYKLNTVPKENALPLREILEKLNARVLWNNEFETVTVIYKGNTFDIYTDGKVDLNKTHFESCEINQANGITTITPTDLKKLFDIDVTFDESFVIINGVKDKVLENEIYAEFTASEITEEIAMKIAEALGLNNTTIKLNEESGYWELSTEENIVMVIRKKDGKIMRK